MDENWNLYVYASFKEIRTSLFLRIIANICVNGMQRQNFTEKNIVKTTTNLEYMYKNNEQLLRKEERETLLGVIEWVVTNQPKHVDEG